MSCDRCYLSAQTAKMNQSDPQSYHIVWQVYKAEYRGQLVALKIFKKGQDKQLGANKAPTAADIQRQLREIKTLQECNSAHVVRFIGLVVFEGSGAVLTEYMPEGDLWTALCDETVPAWSHKYGCRMHISS